MLVHNAPAQRLPPSEYLLLLLAVPGSPLFCSPSQELQGSRAPSGVAGVPGQSLRSGLHLGEAHSQSEQVPLCPSRMSQLWVGYSLLFVEGQRESSPQPGPG